MQVSLNIQNEAIKTFKKIVETKSVKSKEFLENQSILIMKI